MKMTKNIIWVLMFITVSISYSKQQRRENPNTFFYYAYENRIELTPLSDKMIIRLAESQQSDMDVLLRASSHNPDDYTIKTLDKETFRISGDANKVTNLLNSMKDNPAVHTLQPVYITKDGLEMGITDEICVEFLEGVSAEQQEQLHRSLGVRVKRSNTYYDLLSVEIHGNALSVANKYQESGLAKYAHPNFLAKAETFEYIPNDQYFNKQFALHNTGQTLNDGHVGTVDADVDAPEAWGFTQGSPNIVIAIIDEGVTLNHPDLDANIWVNPGEIPNNNIDDDNNGYIDDVNGWNFQDSNNDPSPKGDENHGNGCAGIAAAEQDNNEGVTGIAPHCKIMPVRLYYGLWAVQGLVLAIDYAWENGADVLSNSWGFNSSDPNLFPAIIEAINRATTQGRGGLGSVVCFAASNSANHVANDPGYVAFPANVNIPGVLTVAASNRDDLQANYSPTSSLIDIAAPSHHANYWQIPGESFEIWTVDIPGNPGYNPGKKAPHTGEELPASGTNYGSYTGRFGGTSAACPLVAGVAALMLSLDPLLTQQNVFNIITCTADKVGPYNYSGTYFVMGRSNELGFGRINAYNAVNIVHQNLFIQAALDLPICCWIPPIPIDPVIYDIIYINNADFAITFRRWVELTWPTGEVEEILSVESFGLEPGQEFSERNRFVVAADYPAGTYTLTLYWDDGQYLLYTTATFDKLPGRSQPLVNNSSRTTRLEALPKTMMLEQNYPNPFNPSTTIRYAVPEAGEISLKIYNLNGQLVKTLVSGVVTAGNHQVVWDGTDSSGSQVASGAYLYKLEAGDFVQTRKTVLLQ